MLYLARGNIIGSFKNNIRYQKTMESDDEAVYFRPEKHDNAKLLDVSLRESEYAPELVKELAKRKDVSSLGVVLKRYAPKDHYRHIVRAIENGLKGDSCQETILNQLSRDMQRAEGNLDLHNFYQHMQKRSEAAARKLSTYLSYLRISDKDAKRLLHNRRLLLIGGGIGPIKKDLLKMGIACNVTNIDPMLKFAEDDTDNADTCYAKNFFDLELGEEYDEVWSANNSLPTYALSPKQVRDFYRKSLGLAAARGTLRVLPTHGFSDSITPSMRVNRIPVNNESIRCLEEIAESDLFDVDKFETEELRGGLGMRKKMPGANVHIKGGEIEVLEFLSEF